MSNKLRAIKRTKQGTGHKQYVLAIVNGANEFSKENCAFILKSEAVKKNYPYIEVQSMWALFWTVFIILLFGEQYYCHYITYQLKKEAIKQGHPIKDEDKWV